jgi:hypothetical protein
MTRAQFIKSLCDEALLPQYGYRYVIPELNVIQPIDGGSKQEKKRQGAKAKGGRVLWIGDSLGVGTVPQAKRKAAGKFGIDSDVKTSMNSSWGWAQLQAKLTRKHYAGAVVALQPATGAVLAMASTPSFDPGPLASHNTDEQKKAWADFTTAKPPVLLNRAIQATYPPGSTFKLVDVAAALSSGKFTEESPLTAAPRITLQGTRTTLENYNGNACGTGTTATLRDALQRSCNTAFADLDAQLGVQAIRAQSDAFKIGMADLEIPLPVAPSTIGAIPDVAALQQSAIGQRDVALTPLQNAMIVATIANGGQVMAPYLMKEIQSQDLQPVTTTQPDRLGRAISADEPIEGRFFKALHGVRVLVEGQLVQAVAAQECRIELRRQVGPLIELLALLVELQVQPLADKGQGAFRIFVVIQERLTVLDFNRAGRPVVARGPGLEQLVHTPQCVFATLAGSKAVAVRGEVALVDRFQHHDHRPLKHFVFKGRYANGPGLATRPFRNVHPPHRWRPVRAGLGPFQK